MHIMSLASLLRTEYTMYVLVYIFRCRPALKVRVQPYLAVPTTTCMGLFILQVAMHIHGHACRHS